MNKIAAQMRCAALAARKQIHFLPWRRSRSSLRSIAWRCKRDGLANAEGDYSIDRIPEYVKRVKAGEGSLDGTSVIAFTKITIRVHA